MPALPAEVDANVYPDLFALSIEGVQKPALSLFVSLLITTHLCLSTLSCGSDPLKSETISLLA